MVDTVRGVRRRGRTYVGPVGFDAMDSRPFLTLHQSVGGLWQDMHAAAVALFATPVVISTVEDGAPRVAPIGIPIISYVIDDAWDTQRSRGWAPNAAHPYSL